MVVKKSASDSGPTRRLTPRELAGLVAITNNPARPACSPRILRRLRALKLIEFGDVVSPVTGRVVFGYVFTSDADAWRGVPREH